MGEYIEFCNISSRWEEGRIIKITRRHYIIEGNRFSCKRIPKNQFTRIRNPYRIPVMPSEYIGDAGLLPISGSNINAIIQCLVHTPLLAYYLMQHSSAHFHLGHSDNFTIAFEFIKLLEELASATQGVSSNVFQVACREKLTIDSMDSAIFLGNLLKILHDSCR